MCTISIVRMVLGKGRLDSFLLLGLGPPCCLGQLLDLWPTNSEIFSVLCSDFFIALLIGFAFLLYFDFIHWLQGSKEGMCDLLHNIHSELYHQAFSSIQGSDGGPHFGGYRHFTSILSF